MRWLGLAICAALAGCGGKRERAPIDPGLVTIEAASLAVHHGEIGTGAAKKTATYVLVDARSHSAVELHVAIEGDLLDAAGAKVGRLAVDTLRVPATGLRTFALVHLGGEVPAARSAELRVTGATPTEHPSAIEITDGNVYQDGDRVVVAGTVVNRAKRQVYATIVAGFHDASGKVVQRPFTILEIAAGGQRPARFVGPPGSVDGFLFVGEEVF